ncbi:MAG: hypothetical protein ABFS32_08600 [Bacteroidota bacterium]
MSGFLHRILLLASVALVMSGQMGAQPLRAADPDADSLSRYIQIKYGLDQELVSGFQYYVRFPQYKGDPFFPEDAFFEGTVSLRGLLYDNVRLKYNSFSQSLILEYTDLRDGYNLLRLNNSHIDSFRLGTHRFQKLSLFSEEPVFYQVFSSVQVTCYIHWKKDIQSINNSIQYTHVYTRPLGTYYLNYGDRIHDFTNRKSFMAIFTGSMQAEIKKYFKRQHFSFRKAGPADIQNLLIFISQLVESQA